MSPSVTACKCQTFFYILKISIFFFHFILLNVNTEFIYMNMKLFNKGKYFYCYWIDISEVKY